MVSYRLEQLQRRLFVMRKRVIQSFSAKRNKAEQHVAFVAGVQRSGTNMMMDVLERSEQTDVYHERDRRAFDNYQMRDPAVIHELLQRCNAPCFVIKSLCELQHLKRLMNDFAPARTVWIVRDYRDVVNSMRKSFRNQGKQVKRIAKDRHSDGWQGEGMSDTTHEVVCNHVHEGITDNSAAALIWYFRNQLFFDQGFDRDARVLLVRYEALVIHPEKEFRRIFEFLDLEYQPHHSRKVVPNSIRKAPQPEIELPIADLCDEMTQRFDVLRPVSREVAL